MTSLRELLEKSKSKISEEKDQISEVKDRILDADIEPLAPFLKKIGMKVLYFIPAITAILSVIIWFQIFEGLSRFRLHSSGAFAGGLLLFLFMPCFVSRDWLKSINKKQLHKVWAYFTYITVALGSTLNLLVYVSP